MCVACPAVALADRGDNGPAKDKQDKHDSIAPDNGSRRGDDQGTDPGPTRKTKAVKPTTPAATAQPVTPARTPTAAPTSPTAIPQAVVETPSPVRQTDAVKLAAGAPELGQSLGVAGTTGDVRVKASGGSDWTDVNDRAGLVPDGTVVDAREGAAVLRVAIDAQGTQQAAWLAGAIFTVHQPATPGAVTELTLHGGNFARCDGLAGAAHASARRRSPVIRRLWGNGHGRFRTRGRYAAAVVRGTIWSVEDRCGSTVTKVLQGIVAVRDLVRGTLTNVHAGEKLRVPAGPVG